MARDGFRPDDVVNRRVNGHIESLLPETVSTKRDYHFEGQRAIDPDQIQGGADSCLCYLEAYVGVDGQFEIFEMRRYDHETDAEWQCTNRIARTDSDRSRPNDPFVYTVRTTVEIADRTQSDRSQVAWDTLKEDPIFGGVEAQAATLLAEKMAHRKACASGSSRDHHGSLSHLGSLSTVIDNRQQLSVDWSDVNELLGPDADTIASSAGFERLESDDKRRTAEQKGIDFLSDTLEADIGSFEGNRQSDCDKPGDTKEREPWKTLPPDMNETSALAKITEMQEQLQCMREELQPTDQGN